MPANKVIRTPMDTPQTLTRRIIEHLHEVDRSKLGKPRRSVRTTSKSATRLLPMTTPSALPFYLGKRATSSMKKQRVLLPQTGGVFWYSGKTSIKEIDDPSMEPQPPRAPNIDLPAKASPEDLPLNPKRQSPPPSMMLPHLIPTDP